MGLANQIKSLFTSRDLGLRVERAQALYTMATHPLFTITGGNILLTSIYGITATDAVPGFATTVRFRNNTIAGGAVNLDSGAADLNGAAIGTIFAPTLTVANPCGLGFAVPAPNQPFICAIGVIDIIIGRATTPATIGFVMYYIPLGIGASVSVA
jgi:hypothetical protein